MYLQIAAYTQSCCTAPRGRSGGFTGQSRKHRALGPSCGAEPQEGAQRGWNAGTVPKNPRFGPKREARDAAGWGLSAGAAGARSGGSRRAATYPKK